MTPWGERAQWPIRVQGALVDFVGPGLAAGVLSLILPNFLDFILYIAVLGWALYNAYLNGQTGRSYGKQWAGTKLVREQDGQLLGGGMGIARYFLHILDSLPCYVGWLWPIWDDKRQTFADKIVSTTVVKV
jgi:uncharacterized RDD family membrane protein YckC